MHPFLSQHLHCPIEALPRPLYEVAYRVYRQNPKVPMGVLLTDALAAAGDAVHRSHDVIALDGESMPCTINTLSVCRSGLGKGRSYSAFFKPFYDFEAEHPDSPLLLEEVSYRALAEALHGTGRNIAIQYEDGHSFFDTDLFKKKLTRLTALWSGKPPLKHTVYRTSLVGRDARCSLGMRIQPKIFYPFLVMTKNDSFVIGLWPRAIASCHDPERFEEPVVFMRGPTGIPSTAAFEDRVRSLLDLAASRAAAGETDRLKVRLGREAAAFMVGLQHWLGQRGEDYADIVEAFDRAWENTLRLGAVFHVMCGAGDAIEREMVERAWSIVHWSLTQQRKIFVQAIAPPQKPSRTAPSPTRPKPARELRPVQDARLLMASIEEVARRLGTEWIEAQLAEDLTDLAGKRLATAWKRLEFEGCVTRQTRAGVVFVYPHPYSSRGRL